MKKVLEINVLKTFSTGNRPWSVPTVIIYFILAIFISSGELFAQSTEDEKEINKAIDNYIIGWRTADSVLLSKAFDLDAGVVLWINHKSEPERLNSMLLRDLIAVNIVQEDYGLGYTIKDLKVIDSRLAIAIVNIPMKKGHYIDCLELQKINGTWKIVLKSYVYFPKE